MEQKPKRKQTPSRSVWKWVVIGMLFVFGLCGLFALGVGYQLATFNGDFLKGIDITAEADEAVAQIEYMLKTELPENATDAHYFYTQWQDFYALIRFSLPATDVDAWLAGSGLCFELPLTENYFSQHDEPVGWWQPDEAEQFVTGEQCGTNPYYQILIDQTNSEIWIIYIEVFSV